MSDSGGATIVIKKIKKGGHGHHGGAWKVAYADFVTAMMAFFLLLWLLNAVTEEQLRGISNYFAPTSVSKTTSGSGGLFGGQTLGAEGSMQVQTGSPSVSIALPPPTKPGEAENESDSENQFDTAKMSKEQIEEEIQKREEQQFKDVAKTLRQAIQDIPGMHALAESLMIDNTPEGLRIQLVDQDKLAMFPKGAPDMFDHTRKMMTLVARIVQKLPEKIAISGHTDSLQFSANSGYTNWELSSDRANASRRALLAAGVPPERIARVVGKADTDHLVPEDPTSPRNRRISIVLLRDAPMPTAASATPVMRK